MNDKGRQLKKLRSEIAPSKDEGCKECGHDPGIPITYDVTWDLEDDFEVDREPTHCPTCGRQLVIKVTWQEEHNAK